MGLLNFIRNEKDIRKIFGKKELKIIEKQLLGINLTQSEKNRLSRDIRKKLELIKKMSNFSEDLKLKKGIEIKKIIQNTQEIILQSKYFPKIKRIILYGSVVENKLTFRSDIDIAIEFSDIKKKEAEKFRLEILSKSDERIDIQVYNFLPNKIKKEVDKKARVLYQK